MKRCPQCEFIYEDDQSLCDMDGVLLVLDSRTLPNLHALATVPALPARTGQQRRNRAVPVFASLVLALVLGMVYYVSTRRSAPMPVSATISTPAPAVAEPTPEPPTAPAVVPESKPAETQPSAKKSSTKSTAAPQPKPTPETSKKAPAKKEDNKVNSLLKKTGRILKKPFKF